MLEPYTFPPESEVFVRQAYLARAKAISAKSAAEHRKITGRGIVVGVVMFLSMFSLLVAAHSGLSRAERAYQQEARV